MNARIESLGAAAPAGPRADAGWSSRMAFILAAAGSAVGLGNVWKFPYIAGEYGGGAFVLVYLAFVALIGLPILIAEILVGRRGRGGSPVHGLRRLAALEGHSPRWQLVGWMGALGCFLILASYSVVAGWALRYLGHAVAGDLAAAATDPTGTASAMASLFAGLMASPTTMIVCHALVMAATMVVVTGGIRSGVERAVRWMVPGLLVLLVALVVYAAVSTGQFGAAARFVFRPDFSALTGKAVLVALGHACFTLSVGMTAMMAYGAHLGRDLSIGKASLVIAGLDTLVALLAAMAIFPIVFANGLEPGAGPGLLFVTLPVAFAQISGGTVAATLFFLFLTLAALTSTIALLEPVVEYVERRTGWKRSRATLLTGSTIWVLGIGSALAFNVWSDLTVLGSRPFDVLDFLTTNIMLPLGALLIAVYAGRVLSRNTVRAELGDMPDTLFSLWRFMIRYVAPVCVGIVLLFNLV